MIRRKWCVLLLAQASIISGCVQQNIDLPAAASVKKSVSHLSPGEANRNRRGLNGQAVILHGFLRYRDDEFGLWTGKDEYEENEISECVTPLAIGEMRSRLRVYDGSVVTIHGNFELNFGDESLVVKGPCNFTGIWVTEVSE